MTDRPMQRERERERESGRISYHGFKCYLAINMSGMPMAQSSIAHDLKVYGAATMWFTTSYIIAMSCGGPIVGRFAGTILHPRALIVIASTVFAAGGVLTSTADSFSTLVSGRVLSGVGGSGILTLAIILVIQLVSDERRGIFVGLVNVGFTVGLSLGAVVFGAAVPVIGWRVLFLLQAPVSLAAGLAVFASLPRDLKANVGPEDTRSMRQKLANVDYLGALLMVRVILVVVLFRIFYVPLLTRWAKTTRQITTILLFLTGLSGEIRPFLLLLSLANLVAFLTVEYLIAREPIIPLQVLSSHGLFFSCLAQLGFMAARWAILFYGPIFALAVHGYSPAVAGSILIPTNAGFGIGNMVVGFLHIRRKGSFWFPTVISLALFSFSFLLVAEFSTAEVTAPFYVGLVFLNGLFTGAAINYTLHHLLHLVAPENHFVATSLLGTFRGFAGSLGVAIGGGMFARMLKSLLQEGFNDIHDGQDRRNLVLELIGSPATVFYGGLTSKEHEIAVHGYIAALKCVFTGAFILSVLVVAVQAGTGWKGAVPEEEEDEDEINAVLERRRFEGD